MKQLIRLGTVVLGCGMLALTAFAGSETYSGKEMKQTTAAPAPPPECDWTGFYVGIHGGGQFGHSEDRDLDFFQAPIGTEWGYKESGAVAGGQIGYNWQWHSLVLGPEFDAGYMNLDGSGISKFDRRVFNSDTTASTDSDFYTTLRGRLGFALGKWLIYGTGGGIGVNYETQVKTVGNVLNADKTEFDWGWTAGGGVEYMFTCHWTAKVEYLRYQLEDQDFSGIFTPTGDRFRFTGIGTEGNIIRAGLNYKF